MDLTTASFPILHGEERVEIDLKQTDRVMSTNSSPATATHQWLNVAHKGHKSRQAKDAQILEEYQRYQHELDTCTRLEHLGRRWHEELQPAVCGKDDMPTGSFQEDSDQGAVTELDKRVRPITMNMVKSFIAIHLRKRYLGAKPIGFH